MTLSPQHVVAAVPLPSRGRSSVAEHVVDRAGAHARAHGARLTLLHALVTPVPVVAAELAGVDAVGVLRALALARRRQAEAALAALVARLATTGVRAMPRVVDAGAEVAGAILEELERIGGDLLVAGTHARAEPGPAMVGYTALRLVHGSRAPVLLVPGPESTDVDRRRTRPPFEEERA